MVVLNPLKRPKKLIFLLGFSLIACVFLHLQSKNPSNDVTDEHIPNLDAAARVLDFTPEFLPESAAPCTETTPNLVAFVHSSPSHVPHRDAIRRTWGFLGKHDLRTVFIVGRTRNEIVWRRVLQEAEEHGDLVLLKMVDSYKNLTLKHLSGMKWVISNCPRVPYVLKSDDDIFVDTKRLLSILDVFLGDNAGSKDSLFCHVVPEGSSTKRTGKWMVTQEEYPFTDYPEYCSGLAYFARMSTLQKLSDAAMGVPYLGIDDVFVTGLVAALAGVKRQDLGVRFATNEQPVIQWLLGKSTRPCPWMVAEISPFYWPRKAFDLWNKTLLSWHKLGKHQTSSIT